MQKEAVKLVLWPREPRDQDGVTVYPYVILGMVVTSEPIAWENETIVLQGFNNTELTQLLDKMKRQPAPFPLGDASSALLTVVELTPDDLD